MIFGAWEKSGFGGLQGQFVRRGLLKYDSQLVSPGAFRFRNLKTGNIVDVSVYLRVDLISMISSFSAASKQV